MDNHRILNFIPNFDFGGVENTNLNLSKSLINYGYMDIYIYWDMTIKMIVIIIK